MLTLLLQEGSECDYFANLENWQYLPAMILCLPYDQQFPPGHARKCAYIH